MLHAYCLACRSLSLETACALPCPTSRRKSTERWVVLFPESASTIENFVGRGRDLRESSPVTRLPTPLIVVLSSQRSRRVRAGGAEGDLRPLLPREVSFRRGSDEEAHQGKIEHRPTDHVSIVTGGHGERSAIRQRAQQARQGELYSEVAFAGRGKHVFRFNGGRGGVHRLLDCAKMW